ncbi:bifunctional 4-hydroxy-2-oxoglutarate aldolase/2-dehydro-3-deoxy-phosphogluconate aldolase [Streptomyces sp. NPDC048172]|uniref:bifunctional 4-hydroxy-2-oxoglutarate aldolase/2-dehydro-3-deoxy-phosphogluconate aldolase n=1 Tax=Streptomyces sp. NPDC048172 TaxID=3365505 RepID=UPI00372269A9
MSSSTPPSPPPAPGFAEALERHGLVAILRTRRPAAPLLDVVRTLADAGVRLIEITVPTPGSLAAIRRAAGEFEGAVHLGAGTVTTLDEVAAVHEAGGSFVVSPHTDPELIRAAGDAALGSLPGALTPTELLRAHRAGATAVKVFPAARLGPPYVEDVRGTLPDIPLVPTGGVTAADVPVYRAAGARAVGVGSPLLGDALEGGSLSELAARARHFATVAGAR